MALSAKEKLEKLLEFVNKEEDLRTELSVKAMEDRRGFCQGVQSCHPYP